MNRHLPGELTYPGRWMGHKFKNMKIKCLLIASLMSVTGFAQGVIDVHSHMITPEFVSALEQEGRLMDEGFPLPKYDVESHLKWMDEAGVQTSVLTLAAPQPTSALVVRKTNEAAARIKREHPGRYLFCAALPLPDVDAAIREVKYALDTLGADGIKLATNVQGQYLGTPELDTLFSVLNERQAVVILHPHRPEPVNREVMAQTPLAKIQCGESSEVDGRSRCTDISPDISGSAADIRSNG